VDVTGGGFRSTGNRPPRLLPDKWDVRVTVWNWTVRNARPEVRSSSVAAAGGAKSYVVMP